MDLSDKFQRFAEICKQYWNSRGPATEFRNLITKEFSKIELEKFILYYLQNIGNDPKEINSSTNKYMLSTISYDPSVFANIDLSNPALVIGARKVIENIKVESFNSLPVFSEKSANSALNALIVLLMNDNRPELKKDILQLSQTPYFSILVSSGRYFSPEKYKMAQTLFKENDPFEIPIRQLPATQAHLAYALFPLFLTEPIHQNDKYKNMFYLFAVFQLVILDSSKIKIFLTDSTSAYIFNYFFNYYMVRPSYILAIYLNNFPEKHFNSSNIIKINELGTSFNDDYDSNHFPCSSTISNSNELLSTSEGNDIERILHYFYDKPLDIYQKELVFNSNIIHDQLPNGIFPTYEKALEFLTSKPESINMDTLIDDALHYPSFTPEIANIFMSKLIEKDYQTTVILANQILKIIEDIRIAWIVQRVFFPIMKALYECLNEIYDENQFEVLIILFISLYEGCTSQGDEEILTVMRKFNSNFDQQFCLFLENFLNQSDQVIPCNNININDKRPIIRLFSFFNKCIEMNDVDLSEVMRYPYLLLSAFLWGVKTIHPNSLKLLSLKFPKYKILKRLFVHLSACHQNIQDPSNLIFTVSTSDCSFDLLTRFPPLDESGIRLIIMQHLQQISMVDTGIKEVQGIVLSWRAWINIFSIEKFVLILIETLIWAGGNQVKSRDNFLYAERILATVFLDSIKTSLCMSVDDQIEFNFQTSKLEMKSINNSNNNEDAEYNNKIDHAFKTAVWTTLEFVKNYQGSYSDGIGIASFVLLLIISMKNDWRLEFKKVLDFNNKMLKESNWKSLKYSFGTNFLFIAISILEIHDLIKIDMFDLEFLQMNWLLGIDYFFIHAAMERFKKLKIIS